MRVLCTGGAGFIGSHVVDALLADGHELSVIDNLSSGSVDNLASAARLWRADVTTGIAVSMAVRECRPDAIVHLAAQPSLLASIRSPHQDMETNIRGTLNVLAAATDYDVPHVLYASTGAVYDPQGAVPYRETDRLRPPSPYAISKLAGEMYCLEWGRRNGRPVTAFRFGNVYGPRQVPVGENQLIPRAVLGINGRLDFKVYGDGTHERDYVHVSDIARAHVLALKRRPDGVYNLGTCRGRSTNQVVQMLAEGMGRVWEPEHIAQKFTEHEYIVLDNRAARAFGWEPQVELRAGLAMLLRREALVG